MFLNYFIIILIVTIQAKSNAQILSHVNVCHNDWLCRFVGGRCLIENDSSVGTLSSNYKCANSILYRDLCGFNDKCTCCVSKQCVQTKMCSIYGGKCVKGSYDCEDGQRFIPQLCEGGRCGCCVDVTEPPTPPPTIKECIQTDNCKELHGKCTKIDECDPNYVWNPLLCESDSQECGCCHQPCHQSEKCIVNGGRCMKDINSCNSDQINYDLCDGDECFCCMS